MSDIVDITKRVCLNDGGRLGFKRVMAGEYRCDLPGGGSYHIDAYDVADWRTTFCPAYQVRIDLGSHRTLTDAKISANRHHAGIAA